MIGYFAVIGLLWLGCWLQDPHRRQRRAARRRLADDQARRRLRTRPPS